jgi:hypothetical protein
LERDEEDEDEDIDETDDDTTGDCGHPALFKAKNEPAHKRT